MPFQRRIFLALAAAPGLLLYGCPVGKPPGGSLTTTTAPVIVPASSQMHLIAGLDFSPHQGGQDPNVDPQVTSAQISARLDLIKLYTKRVRYFGSADGLELGSGIARAAGLGVAAGDWISADLTENERQLANLIEIGRAGNADLLIVGSETLLRGELTEV